MAESEAPDPAQPAAADSQPSPADGFAPFERGRAAKEARDEIERRLDTDFAAWVDSPLGRNCMTYLKAITTNTILPATATAHELFYREGGRYLLGIIDTRAARGRVHEHKSVESGRGRRRR